MSMYLGGTCRAGWKELAAAAASGGRPSLGAPPAQPPPPAPVPPPPPLPPPPHRCQLAWPQPGRPPEPPPATLPATAATQGTGRRRLAAALRPQPYRLPLQPRGRSPKMTELQLLEQQGQQRGAGSCCADGSLGLREARNAAESVCGLHGDQARRAPRPRGRPHHH